MLSLVFVSACGSQSNQAKPSMMAGPVPVTVAKVGQENVPVEVHAIGTAEAYSTVTVMPQVDGIIQKVGFVEGQDVKAGQLLFTIDPAPFQAALRQAEANLARDKAQARYAQAQLARNQKLYQSGIISTDQYDQFKSSAEALEAAVRADAAAVQNANIQLNYCTIRSPISGRTGTMLVHPGNLVKNNSTSLVVINQISPIYVDFYVPEQYLDQIKGALAGGRRMPVTARISGQQDPEIGYLSFVNNAVDSSTGTVLLKGTFSNPRHLLWPGQFANVDLVLASQPHAVVVPSQAVQTGPRGQYVYTVKPDLSVALDPIKAGITYQGATVIAKGLHPGETVVTDGQLRLYPGAKVLIKNEPANAAQNPS
jgi:multidrug efflux system membrane fusion protein